MISNLLDPKNALINVKDWRKIIESEMYQKIIDYNLECDKFRQSTQKLVIDNSDLHGGYQLYEYAVRLHDRLFELGFSSYNELETETQKLISLREEALLEEQKVLALGIPIMEYLLPVFECEDYTLCQENNLFRVIVVNGKHYESGIVSRYLEIAPKQSFCVVLFKNSLERQLKAAIDRWIDLKNGMIIILHFEDMQKRSMKIFGRQNIKKQEELIDIFHQCGIQCGGKQLVQGGLKQFNEQALFRQIVSEVQKKFMNVDMESN